LRPGASARFDLENDAQTVRDAAHCLPGSSLFRVTGALAPARASGTGLRRSEVARSPMVHV